MFHVRANRGHAVKLTRSQRPVDVYAVGGLLLATPVYHVHQISTWAAVGLVCLGYVSAGGPPYFNGRLR